MTDRCTRRALNDWQQMMTGARTMAAQCLISLDAMAQHRKRQSDNLKVPMIKIQIEAECALSALERMADQLTIAQLTGEVSFQEALARYHDKRRRRTKPLQTQLEDASGQGS